MAAKKKKNKNRKSKPKNKWFSIVAIVIISVFVFVYVLNDVPIWGERQDVEQPIHKTGKSDFDVEGILTFVDATEKPISNIYIEIADNPYLREKGLMYKYYIPDTIGMLFIFPKEDYRSFWMKNTPSSLDILYATQDFEIIKIHENTQPYSVGSIPSGEKAKYVIEVKAGFVARYQIKTGYRFKYEILK